MKKLSFFPMSILNFLVKYQLTIYSRIYFCALDSVALICLFYNSTILFWGQEEKGTTEDEMAGWHHWLSGHESEWTPGVGDGQGGLACCDSWRRKESDTTERLNWTELNSCIAGRFFTNWAIREAKVTTKNKKLISTNKRFSKIAGYKINIRKVIVFPYTWIL